MSLPTVSAFTESDKNRFHKQYTRSVESRCWIWNGGEARGYGQFWANGRCITSHRFSWIIENGDIPKGMYVLHRCDVKRCCNPAHLFIGTAKDNSQDMVRKGRNPNRKGEHNAVAKLTNKQVNKIRSLAKNGARTRDLAIKFFVSPALISMIKHGYRWSHI